MNILKTIVLILLFHSVVFSQSMGSYFSTDAQTAALAKAHTVSSRGIYSMWINPANLSYPEEYSVEFSTVFPLPSFNFAVGNDFLSINDYNYFFTGEQNQFGQLVGKYLNSTEKEKFKSLFEQGTGLASNFSTTLFALSVNAGQDLGAIGFSVSEIVGLHANLPLDLIDLGLYGNTIDKVYDLSQTDFRMWYLREYSFSYSHDFTKYFGDFMKFFSAGFSVKLVHGFAYAGVSRNFTKVTTYEDHSIEVMSDNVFNMALSPSFGLQYEFDSLSTKESSIGFFNTPAGKGFGFDFGIAFRPDEIWSFGFSVTNIGKIKWDRETAEYRANGSFILDDITEEGLGDSLADAFQGEGKYIYDGFYTDLPTAVHFGMGFQLDKYLNGHFPGRMLILADYHQGFNNQPGNSVKPVVSLAVEWAPVSWLPIRTGVLFGGRDVFKWGVGLGFNAGVFEFNLAVSDFQSIVAPNDAKRIGVAMSSRWRF